MQKPYDLKRCLKQLGAAKLSNLVGKDRVEYIYSIVGKNVTKGFLAEMLISRSGSQILSDKGIRFELVKNLPPEDIAYIAKGDESYKLTTEDLKSIRKGKWSKTSPISKRILEIFGFEAESFFPDKPKKIPSEEIIKPNDMLYPYQNKVKDTLVGNLLSNNKEMLMHMPTGAGKTRTAIEALVDFWRSQGDTSNFMIWLADSAELCDQVEETFLKLWKIRGDREIKLIRLWGNHKVSDLGEEGGFIIASLQKLNKMRTSSLNDRFKFINNMKKRIKLVIVDEAHKSTAPKYKATIEFLRGIDKAMLMGLTATPGRTMQEEISELVEFYGSNKITLSNESGAEIDDPIGYLQEGNYLSKIERKKVSTDVTIELTEKERKDVMEYFQIPDRVIEELSKNQKRNTIIISEIANLYNQGHQIIVFGCSVEHSHLISDLLRIGGIPSKCIDGDTLSHDRREYIQQFKAKKIKVLVNYGVLTTGFDAPNIDAVVITRPTGSLVLYSQMIGRGVRGPKMGGTPDCKLVDLEDNLLGYPSERQAFKFYDNYWR